MNQQKVPVSVIIVSFNTRDLTRKALIALRNSSILSEQIIVVDNNSEDGSAEMIKKEFPEAILFESRGNLGFAKANNLAIKDLANQPYIWLLNSDTETGRSTLKELFEYMRDHHDVGALSPLLIYPDGKLQSVGGFFPNIYNVFLYMFPISYFFSLFLRKRLKTIALYPQSMPNTGMKLDYVTGAAMFLRKEALDNAGLLGEEYFMYFEEVDLCWRFKKAGWKVMAVNSDPVTHVYGGSFKTKYDRKRLKLFLESLMIFVRKNYKGIKKHIILSEVLLLGRLSIALKSLKKII